MGGQQNCLHLYTHNLKFSYDKTYSSKLGNIRYSYPEHMLIGVMIAVRCLPNLKKKRCVNFLCCFPFTSQYKHVHLSLK